MPVKCINFHCMQVAVSEDSSCPRSDPLSFYAKICQFRIKNFEQILFFMYVCKVFILVTIARKKIERNFKKKPTRRAKPKLMAESKR